MEDKKRKNQKVDARGLSCPQPVILAKKGIQQMREGNSFEVLVDTDTAKENVSRLAANLGCQIEIRKDEDSYVLVITKG